MDTLLNELREHGVSVADVLTAAEVLVYGPDVDDDKATRIPHTVRHTTSDGTTEEWVTLVAPYRGKRRKVATYRQKRGSMAIPGMDAEIECELVTVIVYTVYDTDTMNAAAFRRLFGKRMYSLGIQSTTSDDGYRPSPIQSCSTNGTYGKYHAWELRGTTEAIDTLLDHWAVRGWEYPGNATVSQIAVGSGDDKPIKPLSRTERKQLAKNVVKFLRVNRHTESEIRHVFGSECEQHGIELHD